MAHVEEEIVALEGQGDDEDAQLESEVLERVEDELIRAVLPAGCDVECFFWHYEETHANAWEKFSHSRTAVLRHIQDKHKHIPVSFCACQGEGPVEEGESGPKSSITAVEGAIGEIVHVEEEIEELEHQNGKGAELEKEVLEGVEKELIEVALPANCNLGCFFDNHKWMKDHVEHTEEAVVAKFKERGATFKHNACECHDKEIEVALPVDCNLDCFFNNHQWLKGHIEHTKEAVVAKFKERGHTLAKDACDCHGKEMEGVE